MQINNNSENNLGLMGALGSGIGEVSNWFSNLGQNFMTGYDSVTNPALNLNSTVPTSVQNAVNQGTGAPVEFGKPTALGINPQGSSNINNGSNGKTWNGAQNALAMGQMALQGLTSYLNYTNGKKQLALEKDKFLENKAASHANFKNQAMALNTQYRDQMSGRGYVGMSRGAKRDLGHQYENRKVATDY